MSRGFNTTLGTSSTDNLSSVSNVAIPSSWSTAFRVNRRAATTTARIWQVQTGVQTIVFFDNINNWWQLNRGTSGATGTWKIPFGLSTGVEYSIVITQSGTNLPVVYIDGVSQTVTQITGPSGTEETGANTLTVGNIPGSGRVIDGTIAELALWNAVLTDDEAASLKTCSPRLIRPSNLQHYWPLFGTTSPENDYVGVAHLTVTGALKQPHKRVVYPVGVKFIPSPTAGGANVTGSLSATQDNNTASLSEFVRASGSWSATQDDNTASISGFVLLPTGSWSSTQADNTADISGKVLATGTWSATQENNTASITGTVVSAIDVIGSWNATQADNVSVIVGNVLLPTGSWSSAQGDNNATFGGNVLSTGSWSVSQQDNTSSIPGRVNVLGSWTATQDSNTASINGLVINGVVAEMILTQADNTAAIQSALSSSGSWAATQDDNTTLISANIPTTTIKGGDDGFEYTNHRKLKRMREEKEIMSIIKSFVGRL